MRAALSAFVLGGIFGLGLVLSGMTDTNRVQGFLDLFGAWDPTLAFVMGGAILPMSLAWRLAGRRRKDAAAPVFGGRYPGPAARQLDTRLIGGSVLFGVGWGLAGLCPGPALASAGFGGLSGLVFLCAMAAGMVAAQRVGLVPDLTGAAGMAEARRG